MSNKSENINELLTALSKAQAQIEGAKKDCDNPFFKSKYADLSSVWQACREPLTSNGLSIIQTAEPTEKGWSLVTTLGHCSGQWMSSRMPLMFKDGTPQAMGSAITYARRYALAAIAGVAQEDDDGNEASGKKTMFNEDNTKKVSPVNNNAPKIQPPNLTDQEIQALKNALGSDPARIEKLLKLYRVQEMTYLTRAQYEEAMKIATSKK